MLTPLSVPRSLYFYPRSPYGERQVMRSIWIWLAVFSIHALLTESDYRLQFIRYIIKFLSTLSLRRATVPVGLNGAPCGHFYPRSPYGERLKSVIAGTFRSLISIHALLTESDPPVKPSTFAVTISIHALLTESDFPAPATMCSTINFYPRSPYGERPIPAQRRPKMDTFLSTLSLRRATGLRNIDQLQIHISIHALLTGERRCWRWEFQHPYHFYPRSPYGERPTNVAGSPLATRSFLSTLSLRRATGQTTTKLTAKVHFYPRSPYGERPLIVVLLCHHISKFLSTLSLRRATIYHQLTHHQSVFLSTLSLRRAATRGVISVILII